MTATLISLREQAKLFGTYLDKFMDGLAPQPMRELTDAGPDKVAIACVDVIVGFCEQGPLAGPRVQGIVQPVADLFDDAFAAGIRHFLLPQDSHSPTTPEFDAWPAHCLKGTTEAETVAELLKTAAAEALTVFPKNCINAAVGTPLEGWVRDHPEVNRYVVVGDCTDLCVYQLAMYLRLQANAFDIAGREVIVPANCVQTYDLSLETADQLDALPHPGDLLHGMFLYHMALNGIRVVSEVR